MFYSTLLRRAFFVCATLSVSVVFGAGHKLWAQSVDDITLDSGAYLMAIHAIRGNDYIQAADAYEKALKADPDNKELLEGLVLSYIEQGRFDAAAQIALKYEALLSEMPGAYLVRMISDAKVEQYNEILLDYSETPRINPLVDQLVAAWAAFGIGKMSDAVAIFDKIIADADIQYIGYYHKALALAASGNYTAANEILSAFSDGGRTLGLSFILTRVQILSQLDRSQEALALIKSIYGRNSNLLLEPLVKQLRSGETIAFNMIRNGRDGIAEALYTIAYALSTEAAPAQTLIYSRAAEYLNPNNAEAALLSADLLEKLGKYQEAEINYKKVPQNTPLFFRAKIGQANILYTIDKKQEALSVLSNLVKEYPDVVAPYLAYGDMLQLNGDFEQAADAYTHALDLNPDIGADLWGVVYFRGVSYERLGNWSAAQVDLRKALELNPEQPLVLNYLGYSLVDRGEKLDEALSMIEKAADILPDEGAVQDSLAWAYFRLGRYDDAVVPIEKASLLEGSDPVIVDHLGDIYWAVGRKNEARYQWKRALLFSPTKENAARIMRKLEVGLDVVREEDGLTPLSDRPNGQ